MEIFNIEAFPLNKVLSHRENGTKFAKSSLNYKFQNTKIYTKNLSKLMRFSLIFALLWAFAVSQATAGAQATNNWAVLVSTSRFWFNYRHMANVLSMYRTVKRLGIPDSQIILMLSDDVACNPRNLFPGSVFNNQDRGIDLYGDSIEVDYRGYEVTVENFIRLLTDRWGPDHPRSKRLLTDENSNIFIYMTGHGGNEFLKFQDAEEISSWDIADAFEQMHEKKRYKEIFFMIDTCQANTMYSKFYSPNILAVGSSRLDESSYSHHSDVDIGVAVIDRFTYYNLEFLESNIYKNSTTTLQDLFDFYSFENIHSNAGIRTDLYQRDPKDVLITEFFGNVQNVVTDEIEDDLLFLLNHDSNENSNENLKHVTNVNNSILNLFDTNIIKIKDSENEQLFKKYAGILFVLISGFFFLYK